MMNAKQLGYSINIYFVVVDSVEIAVARVSDRVKKGGHSIPEDTIRRRYVRSVQMFKTDYSIIADRWWVFDNTKSESKIIASKSNGDSFTTSDYGRIFDAR